MNKETDIIIRTPVGNTYNIQSQRGGKIRHNICIHHVLCWDTGEEVKYRYGMINIGMPVFINDIATVGKAEHIRKGIKTVQGWKRKEEKI